MEVIPINSTTSSGTTTVLQRLPSEYGPPDQIVSEDGSQFPLELLRDFGRQNCAQNKFRLRTIQSQPVRGEIRWYIQKSGNQVAREGRNGRSPATIPVDVRDNSKPKLTWGNLNSRCSVDHKMKTIHSALLPILRNYSRVPKGGLCEDSMAYVRKFRPSHPGWTEGFTQ